jgi:transposase
LLDGGWLLKARSGKKGLRKSDCDVDDSDDRDYALNPLASAAVAGDRQKKLDRGRWGRRQVVSLVGVAPFANDSGTFRGHRRIRGGRASVRTALYLAAMNASRFNPTMKADYARLREAGKPPKLAFIAIARKILVATNAIARDRVAWRA